MNNYSKLSLQCLSVHLSLFDYSFKNRSLTLFSLLPARGIMCYLVMQTKYLTNQQFPHVAIRFFALHISAFQIVMQLSTTFFFPPRQNCLSRCNQGVNVLMRRTELMEYIHKPSLWQIIQQLQEVCICNFVQCLSYKGFRFVFLNMVLMKPSHTHMQIRTESSFEHNQSNQEILQVSVPLLQNFLFLFPC